MPDLTTQFSAHHTLGSDEDMMTKTEAKYRPADDADETCGRCVHYSPPDCELVSGKINSKYVCDHFQAPVEKKADAESN